MKLDNDVVSEIQKMFRIQDYLYYKENWGMTEEEYERYKNFEMTLEEMRLINERRKSKT